MAIFKAVFTAHALILVLDSALMLFDSDKTAKHFELVRSAAVELFVGRFEAMYVSPAFVRVTSLMGMLVSICMISLIWRAADRERARALTVLLACWSLPQAVLARVLRPEIGARLSYVFVVLTIAAFIRFASAFPTELEMAVRRAFAHNLTRHRAYRLAGVTSEPVRGAFVWGLAALFAFPILVIPVSATGRRWMLLTAMATLYGAYHGVMQLRLGYRLIGPGERNAALCLANGFYTALWLFVATEPLRYVLSLYGFEAEHPVSILVAMMPMIVVLVSILAAVFYQGEIDARTSITWSSVVGALALALPFLFAAIETVLSDLAASVFGLPSYIGSIVAGGTIAIVIGALRSRFQKLIGHLVARIVPETPLAQSQSNMEG